MWVIDEILKLFKNGKSLDLKEIAEKYSLDEFKLEIIVGFLSKYGFIELDKKGRKARLRPAMQEFIDEIQRIREEEAVRPIEL